MAFREKLGELIVPGLVLLGCLLFWLHVQDARSVAQRVPLGVILFTVAMTGVVLARTFIFPSQSADESSSSETTVTPGSIARKLIFIALCGTYYLALGELGFNLANFIFLLLAYPLAGLSISWSIAATIISTVVFYFLAQIMEFNVPTGPFGF